MIDWIQLKIGRAPGLEKEVVHATPITIFVGPNNSGKSKILSEINAFCTTGVLAENNAICDAITFENIPADQVDERISRVMLSPRNEESISPDHILVGKRGKRNHVSQRRIREALSNPNGHSQKFCQWYMSYNTMILDGKNRIALTQEQDAGDLQEPHTSLQVLFCDDNKRELVRRIVYEAFGTYFVIDPTKLGTLRIRLSEKVPSRAGVERSLDSEAVDFHSKAIPIQATSDGVKAFSGMMIEVIAGDPSVLLLDEPEAFLHPSLSCKLGKELANTTRNSEKRVFVATHSPDFVMGCIQSNAPINIVRLTYRNGIGTARILPNDEILRLMRNPLLRSAGVLSALFYESVVVTESDADRAFYQEINERLLAQEPIRGIPNCLFLHAQNKQTIRTIVKPLRELGIPVAGIVDIDVLKDGGTVWTRFLESGFVPNLELSGLADLRSKLMNRIKETGKDLKKDGGVSLLSGTERQAAENLLEKLAEYGLFVIPGGELESWLRSLKASGHGPNWLVEVFEKMGEDPESSDYVSPAAGDVWGFLELVAGWFSNPSRKGIPS